MDAKRKRCGNFSAYERWRLVDILKRHASAVENKKHDACSNERKQQSWVEITNTFNSSERVAQRSVKQLQKLWHDLKIKAKKDVSKIDVKQEDNGGRGVFIDPLIQMVIDIISAKPSVDSARPLSESGYFSESTEKVEENANSTALDPHSYATIDDYAQSVFRYSIEKCFDSFIPPTEKPEVIEEVRADTDAERRRDLLEPSNIDNAWQCTCGIGAVGMSVADDISLCEHRAKCGFIRQNMLIQLEEHELKKKEWELRIELLQQQLNDSRRRRDRSPVPTS